jgi:hypothetical protein
MEDLLSRAQVSGTQLLPEVRAFAGETRPCRDVGTGVASPRRRILSARETRDASIF